MNLTLNILMVIVNLAIALLVTREVIGFYGSDFNGVTNTIGQVIMALLIIEAGFGVSATVALYRPIVESEQEQIEIILSTIKKVFRKIGIFFFLTSLIVVFLFPLLINSGLGYFNIMLIFFMTIFPIALRLFLSSKYLCYFEARQQEYYIILYNLIFTCITAIVSFIMIFLRTDFLAFKFAVMAVNIVNGLGIIVLFRILFGKMNLNRTPDYSLIKGTRDLLISKVVSVIHLSAPVIFMAVFISSYMASIYSVYMLVITNLKNVANAIITGPRNAIGQTIIDDDQEKLYNIFKRYNYIVIVLTTILYTIAAITIMSFIRIYTQNFSDAENYIIPAFAILGIIIAMIEAIHVPSGNIILLSGRFKVRRNIQIIAAITMLVLISLGTVVLAEIGILLGILIANLLMAHIEIIYTFRKYFNKNLFWFLKLISIQLLTCLALIFIGLQYVPEINNFINFFIVAAISAIVVVSCFAIINFIFFSKEVKEIINMLLRVFKLKN